MNQNTTLKIGSRAPVFSLESDSGTKVELTDFKDRWLVLYFYPKDDTPGCTTEACDFTERKTQFDNFEAVVLGVSPDSVDHHLSFVEKYSLRVRLLCDPDHMVMKKYGAWGLKKNYGREYEGVIRSTFLIDRQGKIAYLWRNVKAAGHAEKVLEKLIEISS